MKTYHVVIPLVTSQLVTVEADGREGALRAAERESGASLCHACARGLGDLECDDEDTWTVHDEDWEEVPCT